MPRCFTVENKQKVMDEVLLHPSSPSRGVAPPTPHLRLIAAPSSVGGRP